MRVLGAIVRVLQRRVLGRHCRRAIDDFYYRIVGDERAGHMRRPMRMHPADDRSLRDVLRRVARGPAAGALTADQALRRIRQVIEDAQPEAFHAASAAEGDAWTAGIRADHANLLRAFQLQDEFAVSPAVWEIGEE